MANITMNCAPGDYSAGANTVQKREFYTKEGKIVSLTQKQMLEICAKDPWEIVPVNVLPIDSLSDVHIDEIARRRELNSNLQSVD